MNPLSCGNLTLKMDLYSLTQANSEVAYVTDIPKVDHESFCPNS